jgi:colanic acid biosynthesis glycosyl transferase WcaI
MKILITTQYFYPENFRINDFAFKMVRRGHEVSVITGIPNYPEGKFFGSYKSLGYELIEGVSVYRVPLIPRGKSRGIQLFINYFSFLISAIIFGPFLLRKVRPDIIFSVNYSPATVGLIGAFFSKLKKVPLFLWVQDLWPDSLVATGAVRSSFIICIIDTMVRWIYRQSDLIFVQSRSFGESIKLLGDLYSKKIRYFPNWAEDTYDGDFKLVDEGLNQLLPNDKFVIMFAGNLGIAQSLKTIVKAAAEVRKYNIHWVFLGDGRQKKWLENIVTDYGLQDHISILGRYPLDDMPTFFKLADVMLVTLKQDPLFEMTVPGKIQSYLKNSKPILSALDGEGASLINQSGAGFNVNSGDFIGLANAAIKMSKLSIEELNRMGDNARRYYDKNFNVEFLLLQFENSIQQEFLNKKVD